MVRSGGAVAELRMIAETFDKHNMQARDDGRPDVVGFAVDFALSYEARARLIQQLLTVGAA